MATRSSTHPETDTLQSTPSRSATNASTSSAVASLELLAKRRRLANADAVTVRDTTGKAITTRSSSGSLLRRWGTLTQTSTTASDAAPKGPVTPQPAPRYSPGDREQLLRRLATFQELTDWAPKPDRINEIEWAKRGWVCQGKERLRCTLCSKELVVQLGRRKSEEAGAAGAAGASGASGTSAEAVASAAAAEAAVVDKYVDLVVTAHEEDCLWRKKGCDDCLLRLPLASPRQALADLRQRYDELCSRKDFLPYEFNLRLPAGLDIEAVLATLPPTFFDPEPTTTTSTATATATTTATAPTTTTTTTSTDPSPPNRTALALAIMGWQGLTNSRIGAVPNSASCHACLRRLGLWMFKSKQVDLETNTVLEPAPMDHLDAVREHRFFCPWKNGAVQRNPGSRTGRSSSSSSIATKNGKASLSVTAEAPGWDVLVQLLKNDAYLRNRMSGASISGSSSIRGPLAAAGGGTPSKYATSASMPATPIRRSTTSGGNDDGSLAGTPVTPGTTPGGDRGGGGLFGDREAREEDDAARDAKDKERWARLRRVKSLFDSKGTMAKKLKRAGVGSSSSTSRPGTGHSTLSPSRPESHAGMPMSG